MQDELFVSPGCLVRTRHERLYRPFTLLTSRPFTAADKRSPECPLCGNRRRRGEWPLVGRTETDGHSVSYRPRAVRCGVPRILWTRRFDARGSAVELRCLLSSAREEPDGFMSSARTTAINTTSD